MTLESTEWNQYSEAAFTDKYPIYQLGWFPDYPDADDYVGNFYSEDSFLNIHYNNPEMEKLLAEEKASTDDAVREAGVRADPGDRRRGRADDPDLARSTRSAAARDGVEGVEDTFDPSFIFRFWLISQGARPRTCTAAGAEAAPAAMDVR